MNPPLSGKVAIVTGGSRGIGAATVMLLSNLGAHVIFTYHRSKDRAEELMQRMARVGAHVTPVQADVTCDLPVAQLADLVRTAHGRVDVLFNNAGDMIRRAQLTDTTPELMRETLELNLVSVVRVTTALLPLMHEGSVIINMASLAARNGGGLGSSAYAASKAGVIGLTMAWAKEFGPLRIRVMAVAPGIIATDFHERHATPVEQATSILPIPRPGTADEVARAVAFLAQEGSGFMTGAVIDINGGAYFG